MGFFSQLRYRLQGWMEGRNGVDQLSRDLNIFALAFMLLDIFLKTHIVYWIGVLIFIVAFYRMVSKNRVKRSAENMKYLSLKGRVKNWFIAKKRHFANTKYYRYYKCSSCKQKLRVPKGKGKIEIVCPKCGNRFIKMT